MSKTLTVDLDLIKVNGQSMGLGKRVVTISEGGGLFLARAGAEVLGSSADEASAILAAGISLGAEVVAVHANRDSAECHRKQAEFNKKYGEFLKGYNKPQPAKLSAAAPDPHSPFTVVVNLTNEMQLKPGDKKAVKITSSDGKVSTAEIVPVSA